MVEKGKVYWYVGHQKLGCSDIRRLVYIVEINNVIISFRKITPRGYLSKEVSKDVYSAAKFKLVPEAQVDKKIRVLISKKLRKTG